MSKQEYNFPFVMKYLSVLEDIPGIHIVSSKQEAVRFNGKEGTGEINRAVGVIYLKSDSDSSTIDDITNWLRGFYPDRVEPTRTTRYSLSAQKEPDAYFPILQAICIYMDHFPTSSHSLPLVDGKA